MSISISITIDFLFFILGIKTVLFLFFLPPSEGCGFKDIWGRSIICYTSSLGLHDVLYTHILNLCYTAIDVNYIALVIDIVFDA